MCMVLKYRKTILIGSVQLRFGCVYFFNLLKFSTAVLYQVYYSLKGGLPKVFSLTFWNKTAANSEDADHCVGPAILCVLFVI